MDVSDFNRRLGDGSERVAIALLQRQGPLIKEIETKLEGTYVAVVEDRSSLRLDDRYLGRWRGAGFAVGAMQAALDALRSAFKITEGVISGEDRLPMTALYPLVRSAIENSALAVYLLAPPSRDLRLRRLYQLADDDAELKCKFATEVGSESARVGRTRARAELHTLIKRRGTFGEARSFPFTRVSYTDLVKSAGVAVDSDPAVDGNWGMSLLAWWQLLSGFSHGKQWAFMVGLDRTEAILDDENEAAHVRLSSSIVIVAISIARAVEVLETALRLFGRRSTAFTAEPEDASEPAQQTYAEMRNER